MTGLNTGAMLDFAMAWFIWCLYMITAPLILGSYGPMPWWFVFLMVALIFSSSLWVTKVVCACLNKFLRMFGR